MNPQRSHFKICAWISTAMLTLYAAWPSNVSADVDFVRALTSSAVVRDPCPEGAKPGWHKLNVKDGLQIWDTSMTVRQHGKRIIIDGPSFSKTTIFNFCRNKWKAGPTKPEARPDTQGPLPTETITLDEKLSLQLKLSSQWYHAFDETKIKRRNRREIKVHRESAPSPRRAYTFAITDSKVIIWGGIGPELSGPTVLGDGAVLDLRLGRWHRIATENTPSPRFSPVTALHDGKIIFWGGFAHENKVVSGQVVSGQMFDGAIYDPQKNLWTRIPPMEPRQFQSPPVAFLAGAHFILTGFDLGKSNSPVVTRLNLLERFWQNIKDPPYIRASRLEAHSLGGPKYLVIERDPDGKATLKNLYRLNLATDSMERIDLPDELKDLNGVGSLWTGKRLFVFGGYVSERNSCLGSPKVGTTHCLPTKPIIEKWNHGWVFVP